MHEPIGKNNQLTMKESSFLKFQSPIGVISIYGDDTYISRIVIDGILSGGSSMSEITSLLSTAEIQLQEFFNGKRRFFDLPLDWDRIKGFQREVLETANHIPFGEFQTYGQIAAILNKPKASRAVGAALARNPLPILIPCHRVVAVNGHLTGYLGTKGIAAKKWLLEMEGHTVVGEKLG